MGSIFDRAKTFSFVSEGNTKYIPDHPPVPIKSEDAVIALKIKGDLENREKVKENIAKYGGDVYSIKNKEYPGSYYVVMSEDADIAEIHNYIKELIKNSEAEHIKMTEPLQMQFIQDQDKEYLNLMAKADERLKSVEPDARDLAATNKMMQQYRRSTRTTGGMRKTIAVKDKEYSTREKQIREKEKELDAMLKSHKDATFKEVRSILKSINYENKDVAMFQLARVNVAMNTMKKDGTISKYDQDVYERQAAQAAERLGFKPDAFKAAMEHGIGENLMYHYIKFEHGEQKTEDEVAQEYAVFTHVLDAQRNQMSDDTYQHFKKAADETAKTKIAIIKSMREHPELVVDTGKTPEKPAAAAMIAPDAATSAEYAMPDIRLPLGQVVTITDLSKYKDKKKIGKRTSEEEDALRHSVFARSEVTLFNLMGYRPKGDAASVIAAYDPMRQQLGLATQWAAASSLGLLGSIMGKDMKEFGTGIGKFLRYEMVGDPLEVNPALAQTESWLRNKFDVTKVMSSGNAKTAKGEDTDKTVSRFEKSISECAAPATPAAPAGTSPGGDGFNQPGMISGAGDPIPATKDKTGSGDNFNPRKKKKKEEEQPKLDIDEHVMGFDEFRDALYEDK